MQTVHNPSKIARLIESEASVGIRDRGTNEGVAVPWAQFLFQSPAGHYAYS